VQSTVSKESCSKIALEHCTSTEKCWKRKLASPVLRDLLTNLFQQAVGRKIDENTETLSLCAFLRMAWLDLLRVPNCPVPCRGIGLGMQEQLNPYNCNRLIIMIIIINLLLLSLLSKSDHAFW